MKDADNVLIIRSNPVRPDSRVEKEAYSLSKAGYNVHIYAWDRDSDHPWVTESLRDDSDVKITRIGYRAGFGDGIKKIRQFILFQRSIRLFIKQYKDDIDIIHACDFDTAYSAIALAKKYKKRFIFDVFDFLHGEPHNLFQRIIKKKQVDIINKADATIICTEDRREQIRCANPRKLCVIHNSPQHINDSFEAREGTFAASVVYVGILQDYRLLLEIGEYFKTHSQYRLDIAGFGKYEKYFKKLAEDCDNVFFHGRIPYEVTLKIEQQADIMLAIYDPQIENHRYAAPNKFYEALMLGKPLIMVENTGMSNVVKQNDIGVLIDYSQEGFGKGMLELVDRRDEWLDISNRMKNIYEDQYSWNEMERRLIDLYSNI